MDIFLDPKETELLMSILEHRLEELHREIHHTDSRTFKTKLKGDEALMQGILGKLTMPALMGI
jgi:hypothetical protein